MTLMQCAEIGRLVVFVGAGASVGPPTSLPSWWEMNRAILEGLVTSIEPLLGVSDARLGAARISERQESRQFPPEYQAEVIANHLGHSYFEALQCLDSDHPNDTHLVLAHLAKAGRIKAIITTNFDRAIEAAFRQLNVPIDVHSSPERFLALADNFDRFYQTSSPCQLIKLHGSSEHPATLIDTLTQRKREQSLGAVKCLRYLLGYGHWIFIGYSGADLEAEPNYLYLRPDLQTAKGFTWLVRAGTKPSSAVAELVEAYGSRAAFAQGSLPDWIVELTRSIAPEINFTKQSFTPEQATQATRQASAGLKQHIRLWAARQSTEDCALAMAALLGGTDQAALQFKLLNALYHSVDVPSRTLPRFARIVDALANALAKRFEWEQALEKFDEALALLPENAQNAKAIAGLQNNRALVLERLGQRQAALLAFSKAKEVFEKIGAESERAVTMHNTALAMRHLGLMHEAVKLYESELEILLKLGDVPGRAAALNNLGELLVDTDRQLALKYLNEALHIRNRLGDDLGAAESMGNIANAHALDGNIVEAMRLYDACRATFERFRDNLLLARTLRNIARTHSIAQSFEEAISNYKRALELSNTIEATEEAIEALIGMAELRLFQRHARESVDLLQQAQAKCRNADEISQLRSRIETIAKAQLENHRPAQAVLMYLQCLEINEALANAAGVAATKLNIGTLMLEALHKPSDALPFLEEAVAWFQAENHEYLPVAENALAACRSQLAKPV